MATLAESFMADLADLSDDSAGSDDERQQGGGDVLDGADLLVGCRATLCNPPRHVSNVARVACTPLAVVCQMCHVRSCQRQHPLLDGSQLAIARVAGR
jgi:hypothetical protein